MIKSAVMDYWEKRLRGQALFMKSLKYFHPAYMSLSQTHALFTSCGSSPYEILKAVVQARYLSGRVRVESLTKHWDKTNKDGQGCLTWGGMGGDPTPSRGCPPPMEGCPPPC